MKNNLYIIDYQHFTPRRLNARKNFAKVQKNFNIIDKKFSVF